MSVTPSILYKRATFVTHLPVTHRYAPSHCWLAASGEGRWRVGYTKFAMRMLGELVDVQLDRPVGSPVRPGDVLGTVEGFKAVSEIFCVGLGVFLGANPALKTDMEAMVRDPYAGGWLYEFEGEPDGRCLDVDGYRGLLDATIDRLLEKQKGEQAP